mmetsp:Transcript_64621/g.114946  ORF Transcript_64621/g.114946 Transcript_64621/m.114946 type:complete len:262 (+) Transcript_64621:2-787(+)
MAQALRRGLRYACYGGAGIAFAGCAQGAHLRLQYVCPTEPTGQQHGHAGQGFRGKPLKLLFVGDSICIGVGAKVAAPLQAACAEQLSKLRRRPVVWQTVAANGADVRELQALFLSQRIKRSGEAEGFDFAVVFCGVNDGKKLLQGRWPSVFRDDLAKLCRVLQKEAPNSLITVPPLDHVHAPLLQTWPLRHLVNIFFSQFEAQKSVLAESGSLRCPRLEGPILGSDDRLWSDDGIHPSGEGYRHMGEWLGSNLASCVGPEE